MDRRLAVLKLQSPEIRARLGKVNGTLHAAIRDSGSVVSSEAKDLADVTSSLLALFSEILGIEASVAPQSGESSSPSDIRSLAELYRLWYEPAKQIRVLLKHNPQARASMPVGTPELLEQAARHARLPALHFDELASIGMIG